jgi:ankyrin repeat protein
MRYSEKVLSRAARRGVLLLLVTAAWVRPAPAQLQRVGIAAQPNSPIIEAIGKGDRAAVEEILKADPSQVKAVARNGELALPYSLHTTSIEISTLLLDRGADVNAEWNGRPLIFTAVTYGITTNRMKMLLDRGAKMSGSDFEGYSLLTRTLSNGNRELLQALLEKGVDVNARDERDRVPVLLAATSGSSDTLKLLLDKNPDLKVRDAAGNTVLHLGLRRGGLETARLLVEKGAPLNERNADGETPLHLAALLPGDALDMLLRAGADANTKNVRGDAALHIALRANAADPEPGAASATQYSGGETVVAPRAEGRLSLLVEKTDAALKDGLGLTPLLLALATRDQETRDLLMERDLKLDATSKLFDAVAQSDVNSIKALLTEKPFLVYFRLPNGLTPLHVAALWGARSAAEALLQKGADVNARDASGRSPLALTATRASGIFARRRLPMAQFLIEKGAEINAADRNGSTPLLRAVKAGDAALMAALLEKGAAIEARDSSGSTPLLAALAAPREETAEIVTLLLSKGADPNARDKNGSTPLTRSVTARKKNLVALLLDKGADAKKKNSEGYSPLSRAMENSYGENSDLNEIIGLLLDKAADPNESRPGYNGQTALQRAVESNNKSLAKLLIDKKANINAVNQSGYTALMSAINNGNKEMVAILLEAGADPNLVARDGQSAMMMAQRRGANNEIVELLKAKGAKVETAATGNAPPATPVAVPPAP